MSEQVTNLTIGQNIDRLAKALSNLRLNITNPIPPANTLVPSYTKPELTLSESCIVPSALRIHYDYDGPVEQNQPRDSTVIMWDNLETTLMNKRGNAILFSGTPENHLITSVYSGASSSQSFTMDMIPKDLQMAIADLFHIAVVVSLLPKNCSPETQEACRVLNGLRNKKPSP